MKLFKTIFLITLVFFSTNLIASNADYFPQKRNLEDVLEAAQAGDLIAQEELVQIYLAEDNYAEGMKWLEIAANNGSVKSLNCLGWEYFLGLKVERDYAKSFEYFQKVAAMGFPGCEFGLGEFYALGIIVDQDIAEAERIFIESAKTGNVLAGCRLASLYLEREDPFKAITWYFISYCLLGDTTLEEEFFEDNILKLAWALAETMSGKEVILAQLAAYKFLQELDLDWESVL